MPIVGYNFIIYISSALTTAQLSLKSNEVDYTNDILYAPFGTNFTISCQGGSGTKNWGIIITKSTIVDVNTDKTDTLFQRPAGQDQELVITDFQEMNTQTYQCRELSGATPTVTVQVDEGDLLHLIEHVIL